MGKNLIQQRRGKGSIRFRVPSFRYKGIVKHIKLTTDKIVRGRIVDLVDCPGHSAPLASVEYENGESCLMMAPEGVKVDDTVMAGEDIPIKAGNTTMLKNIPEGTMIYNIESSPGDGGKFVRTSGGFAKIISKMRDKVVVLLPSSHEREFRPECRASIGIIAGSGRTEKPFLKAGTRHHAMTARGRYYPSVSGTSMNAVAHPFGGRSSAHKGRPTQAPRSAPPGRKVGKIAPRRTGRTKR